MRRDGFHNFDAACHDAVTEGRIFFSEPEDRQFYAERFEIVFDKDVSFRQKFIPVIQVA